MQFSWASGYVHPDGRRWQVRLAGEKRNILLIGIVLADGERLVRRLCTFDPKEALAEAEKLVNEQLADGFVPAATWRQELDEWIDSWLRGGGPIEEWIHAAEELPDLERRFAEIKALATDDPDHSLAPPLVLFALCAFDGNVRERAARWLGQYAPRFMGPILWHAVHHWGDAGQSVSPHALARALRSIVKGNKETARAHLMTLLDTPWDVFDGTVPLLTVDGVRSISQPIERIHACVRAIVAMRIVADAASEDDELFQRVWKLRHLEPYAALDAVCVRGEGELLDAWLGSTRGDFHAYLIKARPFLEHREPVSKDYDLKSESRVKP